uniref:Uncharacterized protein n=1 Tax=Ackermannviridae sp. TaxID=2831612 RepID=A0A8S5VVP6_9CAUD|nr:MAG TPA: Protein of unknown function (DUF2370) [Ackermannviridae sp.]
MLTPFALVGARPTGRGFLLCYGLHRLHAVYPCDIAWFISIGILLFLRYWHPAA